MELMSKKMEKVYYKLNYDIENAEEEFKKDPERKIFETLVDKRNNLFYFCKEIVSSYVEGLDCDIEILEDYNKFISFIEQKQNQELEEYQKNLEFFKKKMKNISNDT